ncbi:PDDEXK-like family protein [Flavobacterium sp. WC2509]|uniref:PDDEXK-like family protein n=1 Tax=Flavobacterium sp. WC2509 TaxID=3461406 RepID=UPI0040439CC8
MNEITIDEKRTTTEIKNLLENVSAIQKKYDNIAEITGEKFNVFSVLNLTSNEVRTHSAFIGELLNRRGSHGLKDIPLKLFIQMLEEKFIPNKVDDYKNENDLNRFKINTETSKTIVEKHIGKLNGDKTDGGRIDIIVEDNNKKSLIIENKIYAGEQENQLIRYNNYNNEAPILFLTLKESKPKSAKGLIENKDYFNISYKDDIVKWLGACVKEATDKPMLREVLKQYTYLIKTLTGQTLNKVMSNEIQEIILKNFSIAEQIFKDFENAKNKIRKSIRDGVIKKLKMELDVKYEIIEHKNVGEKNSGIWLKVKTPKTESVIFGIEPFSGNGNERNRLFYGVLNLQNQNKDIFIRNGFSNDEKGWWRERNRFDTLENLYIDFNNIEFLELLGKSEKMQEILIDNISNETIKYVNDNSERILKICNEII